MKTKPQLVPPATMEKGPCGQPCDHPCEDPCEQRGETRPSPWTRMFKASLVNTLDLCFDDVFQEPKKILIVGGCRQRPLAQHIALLLPAAEIVLVDPSQEEARKAEEEICCRFKFIATPLENLPFENETFDLTIAHNFFAYPEQSWQRALSEVSRVTKRNLFISMHRPVVWGLMRRLGGVSAAMTELGVEIPAQPPSRFDVLSHLRLYAKIKTMLTPLPWTVLMTEMKPMREEKLVLADEPVAV